MGPRLRELSLAARGTREARFTQPRAHLLADPCINIGSSSSSEAYISEAGHLTPAGIKKLAKVWTNKIGKFLA